MNQNTLMDTGMRCLMNTLGPVDMERFIAALLKEPFDYTKWRENNLCANMPIEEIHKAAERNWNKKQAETD